MLTVKQVSCARPRVLKSFCRRFTREQLTRRVSDPKVECLRDKLIFCDYLDREKVRVSYMARWLYNVRQSTAEKKKQLQNLANKPVYSVLLKDTNKGANEVVHREEDSDTETPKPVHMPYTRVDSYETVKVEKSDAKEKKEKKSTLLNERYKDLYEKYLDAKRAAWQDRSKVSFHDYVRSDQVSAEVPANWMTDYEQFNDSLMEGAWTGSYGTPLPDSEISSVPCGGCGALLHCKDPALPGYLPSEIYPNKDLESLRLMKCQRCHFLKFYKTALDVKVSPEEYPELLKVIRTKKCAVILIVDLTDFPCSVWPDLKSVLHRMTPIYLVGNKVDLLPQDSPNYMQHIKGLLSRTVQEIAQVDEKSIQHVALVSAKTGYGIEELINKMHKLWRYKGDVYLIGCTNVGKSTLFNALLRSDYCMTRASDLIQRATTSPWPGTTLNLLKFPIMNPVRKKLYERTLRLRADREFVHADREFRDKKLKETGRIKYATLTGYIGNTFRKKPSELRQGDVFAETSHLHDPSSHGLDETRKEYANSRWCYDTPGTIYRDQVLDLLTTDELVVTLPTRIISPRSFVFKPGQTMFLAGLGRIDYLEGSEELTKVETKEESNVETIETKVETIETNVETNVKEESEEISGENEGQEEAEYVRCTLFASDPLPITICHTVDADEVYEKLLTTKALVVPTNDPARLKLWPRMRSVDMKVTGINEKVSAADVVLSSAGWVAITPKEGHSLTLRAWTPEGRGLHLRTPALLRRSIVLRGPRVQRTPMYKLGWQVYRK